MALSLDGNISYIGTEFIKLLNTGTSHLATEEYVNNAIAEGGGGGGGNVDLSNYYTQTETDNLLNAKLNVSNPQDIIGTLRIDSTNGNGKLIVNAVGAPNDEDFYVNGLSNLGGTLKAQVIQASSNIQTSQQIQSNTINTYSNANMIMQRNAIPYITLDSQIIDDETVEKIILMKNVEFSGGLSLNTLSVDTLNTIGLNDMVFNINTLGEMLRLEVGGTVRVPNNRSFISQNIFTDIIRPIAFGNDLICYGNNAADTAYIEYWKLNHAAETLDISKVVRVNEINTLTNTDLIIKRYGVQRLSITSTFAEFTGAVHCGNQIVVDTTKKLTLAPYAFGGVNHFDIRNNHTTNPMIRFRCGLTGEITCMELTTSYVNLKKDLTIENTVKLKTNTIDTNDDNNLVFNRNNVEYFRLTTVESVDSVDFVKLLRANAQIQVNNLQINQFSSGVQYTDFRLENADSIVRYFVGNSTNANFQITHTGITLNREATIGSVKTNTINSNGDNDLVFQRDGTEIFKIETSAGIDNNDIINVSPIGGGMSASNVYCNSFKNRTLTSDTVFYGANSAGDNRVEYMKWNRTDQSLDFNAPIDNTNIAVIGNIVDTTVSDERLKTNIQDVESNHCDCVKNVKIKTFEYKDEKYKDSDKYGFIAQHLQKHLPKEFNNIVKETKPKKDEGEAYLSINYMKLSVVLWGALQETLTKVEHLESRLFEAEDEIKALKGKGKGEAKPKAKSKSKAKNVD